MSGPASSEDITPRMARAVKNSLLAGHKTAPDVVRNTGLSRVSVYTALVWLEARQRVYLTVRREHRHGPYVAQWEAA